MCPSELLKHTLCHTAHAAVIHCYYTGEFLAWKECKEKYKCFDIFLDKSQSFSVYMSLGYGNPKCF